MENANSVRCIEDISCQLLLPHRIASRLYKVNVVCESTSLSIVKFPSNTNDETGETDETDVMN